MGYAELILALEQLPEQQQAVVLDFARFLAQRAHDPEDAQPKPLGETAFAYWINNPLGVADFQPLSREEANAR